MTPTLEVVLLWLLFGGTHIGLATAPVRGRLVARFGDIGFTAIFYLVASSSFAALVAYYAEHRFDGATGLGLAHSPALRWVLMGVAGAGLLFSTAALAVYPRLPMAVFAPRIRAPRGIERITRHPFFAGAALFAVAHSLLAAHAVGTAFFAGLALLAIAGSRHQDHKLLARRGEAYADYVQATSAVPFAAIIAGRQPLAWREQPIVPLAVGVALALALRHWHDALFADGGAWIIGVFIGGAIIAGANAWRRARRLRLSAPPVGLADASWARSPEPSAGRPRPA